MNDVLSFANMALVACFFIVYFFALNYYCFYSQCKYLAIPTPFQFATVSLDMLEKGGDEIELTS